MKKALKRSLSLLLAITIIFGSMYVGLSEVDFGGLFAVKAEAANSNVENAVNWAISIANDNTHGYSDGSEACGYKSRLGPDYDCSSLISSAYHNAGFDVPASCWTGNMIENFCAAGFVWIPSEQLGGTAINASYLQKGDILLDETHGHTELYIGNNQRCGAHWDYDGVTGDSGGKEINIQTYIPYFIRNDITYYYEGVLRYAGDSFENVGDDFFAAILNTAYWKSMTGNSDISVTLEKEVGSSNQLWYFDRQDDGSYVITSASNGHALEMDCGYTTPGNPVVFKEYWGGNYQKWNIYRQGDGYVFVSKHFPEYDLAITLENNSSTNGTRITTSTRCNDSSQIWSIYSQDDVQLKSPTLSINMGDSSSNTTFTWTDVYGENFYNLKIWKGQTTMGDDEAYHIKWGVTFTGYEVQLPAGTYCACVDAVNHYQYKASNIVVFTVPEKIYQVNYNANGGTGAPSSQTKSYGQSLTLSSTTPTRSDYTFLGWVTDPNATVVEYAPGDEYTLNKDITLYALWTLSHVHDYRYTIAKSATCTEEGLGVYTCECGDEYTEEIPATGHQNTMWITEQEPTCTVAGYKDEWCLDCGEVVNTEEISALGHSYGDWQIDAEPTCTEEGSMHHICTTCNDVETKVIPANGHSYSTEWTIDIAATCTEEGSKSHHCMVCDDKGDVTVIASLGHDFKVVSTEKEHPHTISYKCSRCTEAKQETSTSTSCVLCNFTYTNVDDSTCKITGYIGSEAAMIIPATIDGRTVATTTTGAFKNNTTLTSVRIESGVQGIGALAFLGCSSLSKVVIPESVTSIGANAFYNCASDFTLYCYSGSYAEQYAIDNSLNYVVMDIGETESCTIDYANELIYVSIEGLTSLDDIIYVPTNSMVFTEASLVSGSYEFLGTGSIITVFDGNDISSEYTLVVEGDVNGDSVCDVLDAMHVALVSNGHRTLDGAYAMAADSNSDDMVDVNDYQSIVNKAVS